MGNRVGATEAAERLGVDVRSLYAYVSRGSLTRVGSDSRRRSLYDSDEIELLARRARPRNSARPRVSIDVVIGSSVCTIRDGRVAYRGLDAIELATRPVSFETVAQLLWTRELKPAGEWTPATPIRRAIARTMKGFSPDACVVDRMAAALCVTAAYVREAPQEQSVLALIEAVASQGTSDHRAPHPPAAIAEQLWLRVSPLQATAARVAALNCALVLLADHELATSTLAVRVATSARAPLVGALLAGLGTLSGSAHAGTADAVHHALQESKLRRGSASSSCAGFGHPVHRSGDPRTAPLLAAVRRIATPADQAVIQAIISANVSGAAPTADFALGALCFVGRMPPGAASAIFAVARSAGWIAHAAEELEETPLRYRARAIARHESSATNVEPPASQVASS